MKFIAKYVVRRTNKDGSFRYYWQREDHPMVRLPDDEVERFGRVTRLNAEAEGRIPEPFRGAVGSIDWAIEEYRKTDSFERLAEETKISYSVWLRRISKSWGTFAITGIKRSQVIKLAQGIAGKSNRRLANAVLSRLFVVAINHDIATVNHCLRLGLQPAPPRDQIFSLQAARDWLSAAADHQHGTLMRRAFMLMAYTAQRPGDCLAMPKANYNGETIRLRQQKTKRLLSVPCHADLRAELDPIIYTTNHTLLCEGLSYNRFNKYFRQIADRAKLFTMQARDLRRTAVVNLAESGCTEAEISSISGHQSGSIRSILDTVYLVRTDAMAQSAVTKWEEAVAARKLREQSGDKLERDVRKPDGKH